MQHAKNEKQPKREKNKQQAPNENDQFPKSQFSKDQRKDAEKGLESDRSASEGEVRK